MSTPSLPPFKSSQDDPTTSGFVSQSESRKRKPPDESPRRKNPPPKKPRDELVRSCFRTATLEDGRVRVACQRCNGYRKEFLKFNATNARTHLIANCPGVDEDLKAQLIQSSQKAKRELRDQEHSNIDELKMREKIKQSCNSFDLKKKLIESKRERRKLRRMAENAKRSVMDVLPDSNMDADGLMAYFKPLSNILARHPQQSHFLNLIGSVRALAESSLRVPMLPPMPPPLSLEREAVDIEEEDLLEEQSENDSNDRESEGANNDTMGTSDHKIIDDPKEKEMPPEESPPAALKPTMKLPVNRFVVGRSMSTQPSGSAKKTRGKNDNAKSGGKALKKSSINANSHVSNVTNSTATESNIPKKDKALAPEGETAINDSSSPLNGEDATEKLSCDAEQTAVVAKTSAKIGFSEQRDTDCEQKNSVNGDNVPDDKDGVEELDENTKKDCNDTADNEASK